MTQNRTALRTVQIMDLLSRHANGLTLSEVAEHMEIPKTSAFTILQTLKDVHILRQEHKRFNIGFLAYKIGCAYIRDKELYSVAKDDCVELSERLKLSVALVLYEDGVLNYIYQYNPASSYLNKPQPDDTDDCIHAAASGKVMLAYLDEGERAKSIDALECKRFTEKTIVDKDLLREEIELTRRRGYGIDDEEYREHIFCISVPVFSDGQLLAAVSFSGLTIFNDKRNEYIAAAVELGRKLSEKMTVS